MGTDWCFNTSMLLLIWMWEMDFNPCMMFQYIHVTINQLKTAESVRHARFQYIHVTINLGAWLGMLGKGLFQYIHVTINPCRNWIYD